MLKTVALLDIYKTFLNEYTHYGDALDRLDAIQDSDGNIINGNQDDFFDDGLYTNKVFDEGNEAVFELLGVIGGETQKDIDETLVYAILNRIYGENIIWDEKNNVRKIVEQSSNDLLPKDPSIVPQIK